MENKFKDFKYLYGPVFSRRLGFSLGVDVVPFKTCTFDCVYCQLGKTLKKILKRNKYIDLERFKIELKRKLNSEKKIDFITFSGSGEPLLNSQISKILKIIKKYSNKPCCLLTNGSLFYLKKVRKEVKDFDLIIPSLDAPDEETFIKINRPHEKLKFEKIIEGLIELRKEFKGEIWLEIMLIRDLNDSNSHAQRFKKIISKINPDKIQINLPVRAPAERWVKPPLKKNISQFLKNLGLERAELIFQKKVPFQLGIKKDTENKILNLLNRRPLTFKELKMLFNISSKKLERILLFLLEKKLISKFKYNKKIFYKGRRLIEF